MRFYVLYIAICLSGWLWSCAQSPEAPAILLGEQDAEEGTNVCEDIEAVSSRLQDASSLLYELCSKDLKSTLDLAQNIYSISNPRGLIFSNVIQNNTNTQSSLDSSYSMDIDTSASKVFAMLYMQAVDRTGFANRGFRESQDKNSIVYELRTNNQTSSTERNILFSYKKDTPSLAFEYGAGSRFVSVDDKTYVVVSARDTSLSSKGVLSFKEVHLITKLSENKSRIYVLSNHILDNASAPTIVNAFKSEIETERLRYFENSQRANSSF